MALRRLPILLGAAFSLAVDPLPLEAAACFVAPGAPASGSCSEASPCDIGYAIETIGQCEQNTIVLEPGTYDTNISIDFPQPGSVSLIGLGDGVTLQGGSSACGVGLYASAIPYLYVYIHNLKVDGSNLGTHSAVCAGARVLASLDRVTVTAAPTNGISMAGGSELDTVDSIVWYNGGSGIASSDGGSYVVDIDRSVIAFNNAGSGYGGGVYNPGGSVSITNSTIANNTAGIGAGISSLNAMLSNVTLANNTGTGDGSTLNVPGAVLNHSILAGTCTTGDHASPDSAGSLESPGFSCSLSVTKGNKVGVSAANLNLAPLANNGGLTPTMLPNPGSYAIGAGGDGCGPVDQRDYIRTTACDIGAVQADASIPDVIYRNSF
jgi:hypothetical protein